MKMLVYAIKLAQINTNMKNSNLSATDKAMMNIKLNDLNLKIAEDVATGKLSIDDYAELVKTIKEIKKRIDK